MFRRKSNEGYNYRRQGELESNGAKRLPPTEISRGAEQAFRRMGLSDQQILELRNFSSGFRYDLCKEKVERLTNSKVFVKYEPSLDIDIVNLPFFYDPNGRLDGQCVDIGKQFAIQAELSGLIEDLNASTKLNPGYKIVCSFNSGLSKTHFCNEGYNHIWNGIVLLNEKNEIVESVLVDAAFQKIATEKESGYQRKVAIFDPVEISDTVINKKIEVGWIVINGNDWSANIPSPAVLGISNDRKYTFALGFTRRTKENANQIIPTLCRILLDGGSEYFVLNPDTGKLLTNTKKNKPLTKSEKQEIEDILKACNHFQYTEDFSTYPLTAGSVHRIKLRD